MQTHDNKKGIQIVKYFSNNKENAYITHDRTHSSVKMQLTTHIYMQQTVWCQYTRTYTIPGREHPPKTQSTNPHNFMYSINVTSQLQEIKWETVRLTPKRPRSYIIKILFICEASFPLVQSVLNKNKSTTCTISVSISWQSKACNSTNPHSTTS